MSNTITPSPMSISGAFKDPKTGLITRVKIDGDAVSITLPTTGQTLQPPFVICESGFIVAYSPRNKRHFKLNELQKAVGGYIELIGTANKTVAVVNEEGKLDGRRLNELATWLCHQLGALSRADYLVGRVLFCQDEQIL